MYKNFSNLAGCEDHSIECLQQASTATLIQANQDLFEETLPCTGLFPVGPALDGKLIKQLPPVAFDSGNYWKGIESIIVSHVYNESGLFVPKFIQNSSSVKKYVHKFFPQHKLTELRHAVLNQYPADGPPYWGNARNRTEAIIRDLSFTCNTRLLYDAYHQKAKTYMMQYDVGKDYGLALHGTDLLPLFLNPAFNIVAFLQDRLKLSRERAISLGWMLKTLSPRYQSYFVSHAIHGDPNTGRVWGTPEWELAINDSNRIHQVMEVIGNPLQYFHPDFTDDINTNDACDIWKKAARNITNLFPGPSHSTETQPMQAVLHGLLK